jgi:hypothetical protein
MKPPFDWDDDPFEDDLPEHHWHENWDPLTIGIILFCVATFAYILGHVLVALSR